MLLSGFALRSLLLVLLGLCGALCRRLDCKDRCCSFVESFPVRLKELRISFDKIKHYYEANDDIDSALLDDSLLQDFKSPFGCHAVTSVLRFYLDTVLPNAMEVVMAEMKSFKSPIDSIGNTLKDLKREITHCRIYFSCQQPFDIVSIMESYSKMESKGLYKAMGELDLLFNYIEDYMVSKRRKN